MNSLLQTSMKKLGIPTKGMGFDYIKNTSWVFGARIFESFISYLIIILLSRHLGAEGLGIYSFLFSFSAIFFLIADLGFSSYFSRELSKNFSKIKTLFSQVALLTFVASIISFLLFISTSLFVKTVSPVLILLTGIVQFVSILRHVPLAVLRAKNKGLLIASATVIERILAFIGCFIAIVHLQSLQWFIFALIISGIVRSIIFFISSLQISPLSLQLKDSKLIKIVSESFPFMLVIIFTYIYVQLDTVMLTFMKDEITVGWYNAGYKFINLFNIIPGMLMMFGFPLFSKLFVTDKKKLRMMLEKICMWSSAIIIPLTSLIFIIGNDIIKSIYNFDAVEPGIAFKILMFAEIFVFLTTILGNFLGAVNRQRIFAKIAGFSALFNIIMNFILIPRFSLYGAAIATLLTYVIMYLFMVYYIKKKVLIFNFLKPMLFIILLSVLVGLFSFLISSVHWIVNALLSGMFYLLLFFLSKKILKKYFIISFSL